jgi:hypothetical protein
MVRYKFTARKQAIPSRGWNDSIILKIFLRLNFTFLSNSENYRVDQFI